jgi:Helix-turn-helix.
MGANIFAGELRLARQRAGLTQEKAAQAMSYSQSMYAQVEGGRFPSRDFAERADKIFNTDGLFVRLREYLISQGITPDWVKSWWELLIQATSIKIFNPLVIPGIVQSEGYARAQLGTNPERAESLVAARLERQQELLERQPRISIILDEAALHRAVAPPEVMRDQLESLAQRTDVQVLIIPAGSGSTLALDGSFELAMIEGHEVAYVETPLRGFVLDKEPEILDARERWEALCAEALPRRQSSELLRKVAKEWMA